MVTVDALPGVELSAHVDRIGLRSGEYRGDVVYPVYVALDEGAPGLRWGMTTVVVSVSTRYRSTILPQTTAG